uniref:Uncharacterized protein n=1 Tax=Sphaerodactylus townsendi TaxID=933632 RepID=A0ACB8EZD3_9SAUR
MGAEVDGRSGRRVAEELGGQQAGGRSFDGQQKRQGQQKYRASVLSGRDSGKQQKRKLRISASCTLNIYGKEVRECLTRAIWKCDGKLIENTSHIFDRDKS